jgi:hypothetical protein
MTELSKTFYGRLQHNPTTSKMDFDAPDYGVFQSWENPIAALLELQSIGWVMVQAFQAPEIWIFQKGALV